MKSLMIETHPWRGISAASDVFFSAVLVLGWVTVGLYHGSVMAKLREFVRLLED